MTEKKQDMSEAYQDWITQYQESLEKVCLVKDEARTTISGKSVKELYTPLDLPGFDHQKDLGMPGEYPYTRGIHSTMYHGRLWTMRQFSGFAFPP